MCSELMDKLASLQKEQDADAKARSLKLKEFFFSEVVATLHELQGQVAQHECNLQLYQHQYDPLKAKYQHIPKQERAGATKPLSAGS